MTDISRLRTFFEPRSVAIIGARKSFGFGYGLPKFLIDHGFKEIIYLINPNEKELHGLKVYKNVRDLPGEVDLGIVIVPAPAVPQVMADCAAKGLKAVIIESAGFSEVNEQGARLEREIARIARSAGIRVIGPNCVGVVNTANQFASCEILPESLGKGAIAVIAQSGIFGNILLDWGPEQGIAFSKVVTIGNRCDVSESELLEYLGTDSQTRVITLYLEGVKDGKSFLRAAKKVSRKKPIVVLKSGRTEAGKAAAASHTGSISGQDYIYEAAFRQAGVIRARTFHELFDIAKVLSRQPLPKGNRIAVVTSSGSLGVLTVDKCLDLGLKLAKFSPETIEGFRKSAPQWMSVGNPLDVGPSGMFAPAIRMALTDENVDGIIVIPVVPFAVIRGWMQGGIPAGMLFDDILQGFRLSREKPLIITTIGKSEWVNNIKSISGDEIPVVSSPENAATAMAALYHYRRFLETAA